MYTFPLEGEDFAPQAVRLAEETGQSVGIWSTDFGWAYGPMPPEGDEQSSPKSMPGGELMMVISTNPANSPDGGAEE